MHAVQKGTVAYADAFTGFGRVVIVDHGGRSYTLYGHLAAVDVSKGAAVETGDDARHGRDGPDRRAVPLLRGADRRSSGRSRTMAEARPGPAARVNFRRERNNVTMTTRTRWIVLLVTTPLVVFTSIGGLLGQHLRERPGAYPHLRVFEDVVSLISGSYVENVERGHGDERRDARAGRRTRRRQRVPDAGRRSRRFEADRTPTRERRASS